MNRQEALALLEQNHEFPGSFQFRVVVRGDVAGTVSAMVAAAGDGAAVQEVSERPSRNGTYRAVRVSMHVAGATSVLDVYEVLRAMEGVVTAL